MSKNAKPTRLEVNLLKGGELKLVSPNHLEFSASLIETVNDGKVRLYGGTTSNPLFLARRRISN
jgi:hypothetical protein